MRGLMLDDILDLDHYERIREGYRARVLAHKRERRVAVGNQVTMLFEDRETVRYQIQEMARVERIREPDRLEHEIETYGELVPAPDELSATLFMEIPELEQVKPELVNLVGIDECVCMAIEDGDGEEHIRGRFDQRQLEKDRISAVHYVRFPFSTSKRERFASATSLRLRIDHPNYRAQATLGPATRASLLRDLRGETPLLLELEEVATVPSEEILLERGGVRAYRLRRPIAAEHVVVEPLETSTSLLDAGPGLLAELMVVVQRFAREMTARTGACRVTTRVAPEAGARLQWHLVGEPE
jgi:hypothetical protein